MDIKDRLRYAIRLKFKSIKEFSAATGIAYRTVQGYLSGDREPDAEQLGKMYAQVGINIGWLLTGKGAVFLDGEAAVVPFEHASKRRIKRWVDEFWEHSGEKERYWLEMQMEMTFPQYREWIKKNESGNSERDAGQGVASH
jgi:transcriptional regulator with XRE-family HTH domain